MRANNHMGQCTEKQECKFRVKGKCCYGIKAYYPKSCWLEVNKG